MRILHEDDSLALFTLDTTERLTVEVVCGFENKKMAILYSDGIFVPYRYRHTVEVLTYTKSIGLDLIIFDPVTEYEHSRRLLLTHRNKKDKMVFKLKYGV